MKHSVMLLLIAVSSILLLSSPSPAMALSMPSVTAGYTLNISSPSDNTSTSAIEVQAGEYLTVEATADISYNGFKMTSPPITVKSELHLLNGSGEISSGTKSETVAPMVLEDGKSYTMTGNSTIKVPPGTVPGTYRLNCDATAKINWMFMSMDKSAHRSFDVVVTDKYDVFMKRIERDQLFLIQLILRQMAGFKGAGAV